MDLTICRGMLLLEREGCSIRAQIAAASRVSLQTYPRAGADFTVHQATWPDSVDRARQRFQLHAAPGSAAYLRQLSDTSLIAS